MKVLVVKDVVTHWDRLTHRGDAYMRNWTGSTLVQVMACRLLGAKPLPEPVVTYCQLDPQEQTSVNFFNRNPNIFIDENTFENAVCNWQPFCFGLKGVHCTIYFMRVQCMYRLPMSFNSVAYQTLPCVVNWTLRSKVQWNFNRNPNIFYWRKYV